MKYISTFLIVVAVFYCSTPPPKPDPEREKRRIYIENLKKEVDEAKKKLELKDLNDEQKSANLFTIGKNLVLLEECKTAIEPLLSITKLKGGLKYPHLAYWIGMAYYCSGSLGESIPFLIRSDIEDKLFEPDHKLRTLANAYFKLDKYGQALFTLGKAAKIKSFQKDLMYYEMAVQCFYKMNMWKRIPSILQEGQKKFPNSTVLQQIESNIKSKEAENSKPL